jgi:hypothetical protein
MQLSAPCHQSSRRISRKTNRKMKTRKEQKSEPWTPQRTKYKKREREREEKLRLFHNIRAGTQDKKQTKIFTSTSLGTALQRIEPDDPQHPANERPGGHHHAHVPEKPSRSATPPPSPRSKKPAKSRIFLFQ